MFIWIYRLIFIPALLIVVPVALWKNRGREGQWQRTKQHFRKLPDLPRSDGRRRRIWLQAVSVGEMLALEPVLRALAERDDVEVVLSTTTSTGYRLACEKYADQVLTVLLFPLDFWPIVRRAWEHIRPDLFVLMESEFWPEHLTAARRRGVPVMVINARISDRSFRRVRWFGGLSRNLYGGVARLLAVSPQVAERFTQLGVPPERIEVVGNLKLDTALPELNAEEKIRLRTELGFAATDRIVVGASTWPGEERALLRACRREWTQPTPGVAPLKLLLVPRHAERRGEVQAELEAFGVTHHVRSHGAAAGDVQVCLADTTGELSRLVQLGEVVWVGKSLPPHHEGQTPIEAARLGRPVMFGPGMTNFREIANELVEQGVARRAADEDGLVAGVRELLGDAAQRERMSEAGRAWHQHNAGANDKTFAILEQMLEA